jgi:hypothetical protein
MDCSTFNKLHGHMKPEAFYNSTAGSRHGHLHNRTEYENFSGSEPSMSLARFVVEKPQHDLLYSTLRERITARYSYEIGLLIDMDEGRHPEARLYTHSRQLCEIARPAFRKATRTLLCICICVHPSQTY